MRDGFTSHSRACDTATAIERWRQRATEIDSSLRLSRKREEKRLFFSIFESITSRDGQSLSRSSASESQQTQEQKSELAFVCDHLLASCAFSRENNASKARLSIPSASPPHLSRVHYLPLLILTQLFPLGFLFKCLSRTVFLPDDSK